MFVSNLFVPLEQLPAWLGNTTRWTPAAMLVDMLRPGLLPIPAAQPAAINALGLACYGLLALVLAARLFRWEPRGS